VYLPASASAEPVLASEFGSGVEAMRVEIEREVAGGTLLDRYAFAWLAISPVAVALLRSVKARWDPPHSA